MLVVLSFVVIVLVAAAVSRVVARSRPGTRSGRGDGGPGWLGGGGGSVHHPGHHAHDGGWGDSGGCGGGDSGGGGGGD